LGFDPDIDDDETQDAVRSRNKGPTHANKYTFSNMRPTARAQEINYRLTSPRARLRPAITRFQLGLILLAFLGARLSHSTPIRI
jgi:hypothetical protein